MVLRLLKRKWSDKMAGPKKKYKYASTASGRTLYSEFKIKQVKSKRDKGSSGAISASDLGRKAKRGGKGVKGGKGLDKPVHSASCGVNQSCK